MWELDYKRKLSTEELMLFNCGVGEDSWESLGLQRDPTSLSKRGSILSIHWKDWCWSWNSSPLATWCKELTHRKRPSFWEGLKHIRRSLGASSAERGQWGAWKQPTVGCPPALLAAPTKGARKAMGPRASFFPVPSSWLSLFLAQTCRECAYSCMHDLIIGPWDILRFDSNYKLGGNEVW